MLDINLRNFIAIGLLTMLSLAIINVVAEKSGFDVDLDTDDNRPLVHPIDDYDKRR